MASRMLGEPGEAYRAPGLFYEGYIYREVSFSRKVAPFNGIINFQALGESRCADLDVFVLEWIFLPDT